MKPGVILHSSLILFAAILTPYLAWGRPSLTVYNNNFAVVRQDIRLDLKKGVTSVKFDGITAHLEPTSVILRDPKGKHKFHILEQSYRGDALTQNSLMSRYEGQTIDFLVMGKEGKKDRIVRGKIIRSGYVPHLSAYARFGPQYAARQYQLAQRSGGGGVIIEVDGKIRFSSPGIPLFPDLKDDAVLKPAIEWEIESARATKLSAELSYVTGGITWSADYNAVSSKEGGDLELTGWVSISNHTGKSFRRSKIKLMAGDVSKIQTNVYGGMALARSSSRRGGMGGQILEKSFDEYHLYTLSRAIDLKDRSTKQVELLHASGVKSKRRYIYDGVRIQQGYQSYSMQNIRGMQDYGTLSNPKVWVMREIRNSKKNNLGMPLPKGKIRFFLRDTDGQIEMVGENQIDHTPTGELLRLYTGNAFDIVGERKRTHFYTNNQERLIQEKFEIKLRNRKKKAVTVTVVEHLYRWSNWEIDVASHEYKQTDSQTIEFEIKIPARGEVALKYSVHYSW